MALKDIKTVNPAFCRCESTNFCPSIESKGVKWKSVEVFHAAFGGCGSSQRCLWRVWKCSTLPVRAWKCSTLPVRAWKCSMLPVEGVEVFHAARGVRGSVPRCLWRAWNRSMLPVEGMEVFYAFCVGHGSVPRCPWRAFHAACGGCGRVPRCPWRAWKLSTCSTLPVEGMEVFHAALEGRGSVPRCLWRAMKCFMLSARAWKCSTLPVEGLEVFHADCRCQTCLLSTLEICFP